MELLSFVYIAPCFYLYSTRDRLEFYFIFYVQWSNDVVSTVFQVGKINSLDFHRKDDLLVTASEDDSIRLYDIANAK